VVLKIMLPEEPDAAFEARMRELRERHHYDPRRKLG
jgi:hypothetical protein